MKRIFVFLCTMLMIPQLVSAQHCAVRGEHYHDTLYVHPLVIAPVGLSAKILPGYLQDLSLRFERTADSIQLVVDGDVENFIPIGQVVPLDIEITDTLARTEIFYDSVWVREKGENETYLMVSNTATNGVSTSKQVLEFSLGRFNTDGINGWECEFPSAQKPDTLFNPSFVAYSWNGSGFDATHSYTDRRRDTANLSRIEWTLDLKRCGIALGAKMYPLHISWNPQRVDNGLSPVRGNFYITDTKHKPLEPFVEGKHLKWNMALSGGRFDGEYFSIQEKEDTVLLDVRDSTVDTLMIIFVPKGLEKSVKFPQHASDINAYPTAFTERVTISHAIGHELNVVSARGNIIQKLDVRAGSAIWNGRDLSGAPAANGVYFIRDRDGKTVKVELRR